MPELPEVETIRRQLAPLVEGRRMLRVEVLDPRWSRPLAPAELEDALRGRRVLRLQINGEIAAGLKALQAAFERALA